MSRNFHNVHVHAPTKKARDQVVKAVLAYAKKAGFSRVKKVADADRVIRLGGRAPWFSIEDDAYGAEELAKAVAKATKLSVLEAYCEASAIVSLGLYAGGRRVGGWWAPGNKPPPAKHVAPLLAKGTPADLTAKWDEGIRQVFPETALAVAAKQLGIPVPQMIGDTNLRAVTIALARKQAAWKPTYKKGPPALYVGWGSNSAYGGRHLVFEGDVDPCHRVHVASQGGPGKGFEIAFSGSALDAGHLEILDCKHEGLQLVRDGNTWRDPAAAIPAGFAVEPDTWKMSRRESDRVRELQSKLEWYVDVSYRAVKEGECDLVSKVTTTGAEAEGALNLHVMWKPWRPSVALEHVSNSQLFAMHRRDISAAYITLRGPLVDAWAWARPHVEAWTVDDSRRGLHVMREHDVLLSEEYPEGTPIPFDTIAPRIPIRASTPFTARGRAWIFGTDSHAPWRMHPDDKLAIQLVLFTDRDEDMPRLEAICDDAIAKGVAYSALAVHQQYHPETTTAFEQIALGGQSDVVRCETWHANHVRGVDKRIWLSAEQLPQLDRTKLPDYITVTSIGGGARLQMPDDRMRAELEPVIDALGSLVPRFLDAERYDSERTKAT